jgi:hypothetical protein
MLPKPFLWPVGCTSLLIVALLPVGAFPQTNGSFPHRFKLETRWEATVQSNGLSFSLAACPDGTVFAMYDQNLKVIGTDGKTIEDDSLATMGVSVAPIACDAQKKLFVADNQLSIFEPRTQGGFKLASKAPLKVFVARMLVARDGLIYAITAEAEPSLIAISDSGKEVLLREENPPASAPRLMITAASSEDRGCGLAWDGVQHRLAYIFPEESKIEFWKETEDVLKRTALPGSKQFEPLVCPPLRQSDLVSLPNGRFARTRIETSEIADVYDRRYLDVLDGSLNPVARPVPTDDALFGSSDDGSLYFVSLRDNRMSITKQELVEDDTIPAN